MRIYLFYNSTDQEGKVRAGVTLHHFLLLKMKNNPPRQRIKTGMKQDKSNPAWQNIYLPTALLKRPLLQKWVNMTSFNKLDLNLNVLFY